MHEIIYASCHFDDFGYRVPNFICVWGSVGLEFGCQLTDYLVCVLGQGDQIRSD